MSRTGSAEEPGIVQRDGQGCVSNPHEGSKIPTCLFRTRLVCSSLLHPRSSRLQGSRKFVEVSKTLINTFDSCAFLCPRSMLQPSCA